MASFYNRTEKHIWGTPVEEMCLPKILRYKIKNNQNNLFHQYYSRPSLHIEKTSSKFLMFWSFTVSPNLFSTRFFIFSFHWLNFRQLHLRNFHFLYFQNIPNYLCSNDTSWKWYLHQMYYYARCPTLHKKFKEFNTFLDEHQLKGSSPRVLENLLSIISSTTHDAAFCQDELVEPVLPSARSNKQISVKHLTKSFLFSLECYRENETFL